MAMLTWLALALLLCGAALAGPSGAPEDGFFLRDGERVLFLGDSNTQAGTYVQYADAYLRTRFPDRRFDLINLGLASETVSGLSEPDHPFPRPDLHERLDRALERTKPDVVVACYGMNDGIYYPFDEQRFGRFRAGIERLVERVRQEGARLTLITPPPFDPVPLGGKVQAATAARFSWLAPYAGYDEVLSRYGEWLLTLRTRGILVVDAHTGVRRYLEAVRRAEPKYVVSSDGIHLNETGHWLLARELMRAWGAAGDAERVEIDALALQSSSPGVTNLKADGGTIAFRWTTRLPTPRDPGWDPELRFADHEGSLEPQVLLVTGTAGGRYELFEDDRKVGEVTAKELASGVDLRQFPGLTTNRRAAEVLQLVKQRQRLLSSAWLSAVGHRRPGTPAGLPLEEARRQAAPLEERLRELCKPLSMSVHLVTEEPRR